MNRCPHILNRRRRGFTLIELLVAIFVIGLLIALLLPAVMQAREASRRAHCRSNLKQIGIGMHSYHSAHGMFPPGMSRIGSMHVSLLPHIGERPLYNRVDYSTPMHLNPLRADVPALYVCPSDSFGNTLVADKAATNYAGNFGSGVQRYGFNGMFESLSGTWPAPQGPVRERDVTDGLSNTAAVSEILVSTGERDARRTNWNTPRQIYEPDELDTFITYCEWLPIERLNGHDWASGRPWIDGNPGWTMYNHAATPNRRRCFNGGTPPTGTFPASSEHPGGVNLLFGDGHVEFVDENINLIIWRAYGSRNGDEVGF